MFDLRSARLELDELRERSERLDADWAAGRQSRLLNFYVGVVTRMLDAERCSIFISDPATGKLWLKCGTGVGEREIEVGMADSMVGLAVTSESRVILHDMESRPGAHRATDASTGFVTRSVLCVPIRTLDGKRIAGAVEVLNKSGNGRFTDDDCATLEETAHFLQLSIENIYYKKDALDALRRVTGLAARAARSAAFSAVGILVVLIAYWTASSLLG